MPRIAIAYHSGYGHNEVLAHSVAQGVRDAGGEAELISFDVSDRAAVTAAPVKKGELLTTANALPEHVSASLAAGAPARQGPFSLPSAFVVSADAPTAGTDAGTTFWSPRHGLSYRVQLAADAGFTRMLSDDWLSGSQVALPTGAEAVYLRWQSRDTEGRTSRLSPVHRLALNTAGLRTGDNEAVKAGDKAVGVGNETLQRPR